MLLQIGRPSDRIGQAKEIHLRTTKRQPMQIDGEPVLMEPVDINIKLNTKAIMIDAKNHKYGLDPAFKEKLDNIIAFYNPKSGGQKGEIINEKLQKYLKHENIYDLTKGGPKDGY